MGGVFIIKQFVWRAVFSAVFVMLMLYLYKDQSHPLLLLIAATPFRAACVIGVLFAVCALGVVPPLSFVYLLCGIVLPFRHGLIMCICGSTLVFSFSYFLGKHRVGAPSISLVFPVKGGFLTALVLRCIRIAPCKTVGICMGGAGFPFWSYLLGSLVGSLPAILVSLAITK